MGNPYEQFIYVISGINRHIQKLERDEMEKHGYKGAFAQYLTVLERAPQGLTCAELCRLCDKDKAAVSRIVSEMEKKELVARQGGSPRQYRAPVTLTDTGRQAARYVLERSEAAMSTIDPSLDAQERRTLYDLLERIATKLHVMSREGIPIQE